MKLYYVALGKGIEDGRLHSRIGDLLVRSGKKDEAIPEYEKAAKLNPADTGSQTNLAVAYLERGRVRDAERVFKWVITTDPQSAAAYNGLGLIAIQRSDTTSARGYFEKACSARSGSDRGAIEPRPHLPDGGRARQSADLF